MNKHSIYILEDEIITQELLKQTAEKFDFQVFGMATNAEVALQEINELDPDIVILDIKVEGPKTGIWLGDQLEIPIIYLTAFSDTQTIKNAISTKPASYLVKPFKANDLFIALELAVEKISSVSQVIIKERDKNIIVQGDDILFAKKEDQYLSLHLKETQKLMRSSISSFLNKINSDSFIQVHRSYIVNLDYVSGYNSKEVIVGNHSIPVSKTFAKQVVDRMS